MMFLCWHGTAWTVTPVDVDKATRVKAAYLFHLARLAQWPSLNFSGSEDTLCIGIVGDDSNNLAEFFRSAAPALKAAGRKLSVRLYAADDVRQDIYSNHILFFTDGDARAAGLDVPRGVLTAGDTPGFCRDGGMVGFVLDGERIRIEVNRRAVETAGIRLGAEFLQHVRIIETPGGKED